MEEIGFAERVYELCKPAYADVSKGGRPGIDPVVYLKMLMVGFFEGLESERAISSRCADSLSARGFLGYSLSEPTPEHSSLTVIRQRLGVDIYQGVFELILEAIRTQGLLKGRNLGIDSSVIEANASLRSLVSRNTEEAYWEYVKRLAKDAGVDEQDAAAVRRFDMKRPGRKTSNKDWVNPHDPDAKVGKTKDGATDMTYKPEHTVDLDTGIIVQAEIMLGDQADTEDLSGKVLDAVATLHTIIPAIKIKKPGVSITADKGYFAVDEVGDLQECAIRTVITDPHRNRRCGDLPDSKRAVLRSARCAVKSKSGKSLLRRRGQHIERSFEHVLDCGGLRRATLRGRENLSKRHKMAAAFYNLSQLLRTVHGIGTPKQWIAAGRGAVVRLCALLWSILAEPTGLRRNKSQIPALRLAIRPKLSHFPFRLATLENSACSTVC